MAAASAKTMTARNILTRRLVKNLNVAPSTNGFKPQADFAVHSFLDHVLKDRRGHFGIREWRDGLHSAFAGFRYEYLLVVLADFVGRGPDQLSKLHIKEFLNS